MRIKSAICILAALAFLYKPVSGEVKVDTSFVNLSVRPSHSEPPSPVDDLQAHEVEYQTSDDLGRVRLTWTAPETYLNTKLEKYYIRWSTESVTGGEYQQWWENADGLNMTEPLHEPGEEFERSVCRDNGLSPGSTYYFSIKAVDEFGNVSGIDEGTLSDDQAFAVASWPEYGAEPVEDLRAYTSDYSEYGERRVDLEWTAPPHTEGALISEYDLRRSTISMEELGNDTTAWWQQADRIDKGFLKNRSDSPGDEISFRADLAKAGATYYFSIRSYDEFGVKSKIDENTRELQQAHARASWDNIPPAAIDDLEAERGLAVRSARLDWSAPGNDGMEGNIYNGRFMIRWSTDASADWESGDWDGGERNIETEMEPEEEFNYVIEELEPLTTYYFHIWTFDGSGNRSDISNKADVLTSVEMIYEGIEVGGYADDDIDGGIELEWESMGGEYYVLKYDERSSEDMGGTNEDWWEEAESVYPQEWIPAPDGEEEYRSINLLPPGATYYVSLRAVTGSTMTPVGNVAKVVSGDAVPKAPEGLELALEEEGVRVSWDENPEPDIDFYLIERRKDGDDYFVEVSTADGVEYLDDEVKFNRLYEYRIKVYDWAGHESDFSEIETVYTGEKTLFDDVVLLRIENIGDDKMSIKWDAISESKDLKGYRVEKSDKLTASGEGWREAGFVYSTSTLRYEAGLEEEVKYYRVRSVSWAGDESSGSMSIDTSDEFNHLYISSDEGAVVRIPYSFATELYPRNNDGDSIALEVNEKEGGEYLMKYDIRAYRDEDHIEDFRFMNTRKGAEIIMNYGEPGSAGGGSVTSSRPLSIFWHNGVKWMRLGGVDDAENERIYTYSRRLGRFALGYGELADEFKLNSVEPKIFTPEEGDYRINEVSFYFENPKGSKVDIRIFDVNGRQVRSNLRRDGENKMVWDGRDESGNIVRGGVYIYRVEAEGKVINGTIVVAK